MSQTPGLITAAPGSGSGKTVVTLGLLRALRDSGIRVAGAKAGPDYIDPAFHSAASDTPAINLDPWAMRPETLSGLITATGEDSDLIVAEGVMGLFDGANLPGRPDAGSTADLAALTGWPVILVIDAARQAASAAALLAGFAGHREDVPVTGVIFNRVASPAHEAVLRDSVAASCPGIKVLGAVHRNPALTLPERHLGLVQAGEHTALDDFISAAGAMMADAIDLSAIVAMARPGHRDNSTLAAMPQIPPLGQRIAVARDDAFAFSYDSVTNGWRRQGANIEFFSPLADEAPPADADAIYLPGGYPELHGETLAGANRFMDGLRVAAGKGVAIFGECGGYMVLGQGLVDAAGRRHEMAGLLPVETSFATRKLHLGYRSVATAAETVLGPKGTLFKGHEFHYASILSEGNGSSLFIASNARGDDLGPAGLSIGSVAASFIHLIDRASP